MRCWPYLVLGCGAALTTWVLSCNEFQPAAASDAGDEGDANTPSAPLTDAGAGAEAPRCVSERIDLSTLTLTADNTFVGDSSGTGTLVVGDAGVTAEVTSGNESILKLVLTARGFTRRLGYPAKTAKIRFETTTNSVQEDALVGCWIIHADSRTGGFDLGQAGFAYGTYEHRKNGRQLLRARAPVLRLGDTLDFGVVHPIDGTSQIVRLESVREGDRVTFGGALEAADGGLTPLADGGSIGFVSSGLSPLPTEIVCGVSVYDEHMTARATVHWVEIEACP